MLKCLIFHILHLFFVCLICAKRIHLETWYYDISVWQTLTSHTWMAHPMCVERFSGGCQVCLLDLSVPNVGQYSSPMDGASGSC